MKSRVCLGLAALSVLLLLPNVSHAQVIFFGNRAPITPFGGPFRTPGTGFYGYPSTFSPYGYSPYGSYSGYPMYSGGYGAYSTYGYNPLLQPLPYSGTYTYYANLPAGTIPRMRQAPLGAYPSDNAASGATGSITGTPGYSPAVSSSCYQPALSGAAPATTTPAASSGSAADPRIRTASYAPATGNAAGRAILQIKVPTPAAELWVEGQPIESFGLSRRFVSPRLGFGTYQYRVRARWSANGEVITQTQNVNVHSGDTRVVAFPTSR